MRCDSQGLVFQANLLRMVRILFAGEDDLGNQSIPSRDHLGTGVLPAESYRAL